MSLDLAATVGKAIGEVPLWNWALQLVGLVSSYVGAELNARMKVSGFVVWLASNFALAVLHFSAGLWLLLALDVLYFRINVLGALRWTRDRPEQSPAWLVRLVRAAGGLKP